VGARLGQHFLIDEGVRDAIVAAARIEPGDRLIEIGPGRGFLTRALLARAREVTAVELDDWYAESAADRLQSPPNLRLIHADFLKLDLSELGEGPFKFVANLPYSVATPILQKILDWPRWTSAVLMFQKEVAERVAAAPGSGRYGLLALSVRLKAEAELVVEAPRQCFSPPPKVSSAVVRLLRLPRPLAAADREQAFFRLAKAVFSQRRKMAAGVLAGALRLPRARVVEAFSRCSIPADARPEQIPLEGFLKLAELL
jgi:16S rRNA (adenine1518-N6/adenine1519-N6)-dimethyltransferase